MASSKLVNFRLGFKSCPREGASCPKIRIFVGFTGFKSCPREGASAADLYLSLPVSVSSRAPVRGHQGRPQCANTGDGMFQVVPP